MRGDVCGLFPAPGKELAPEALAAWRTAAGCPATKEYRFADGVVAGAPDDIGEIIPSFAAAAAVAAPPARDIPTVESLRLIRGVPGFGSVFHTTPEALSAASAAPGAFCFASSLRMLVEVLKKLNGALVPDERALALYLLLGRTPAPHTLFRSLRRLAPGAELLLDRRRGRYEVFRDKRPWTTAADDGATTSSAWPELLERSLGRILNLAADRDSAIGFSGGVDSSLSAALSVEKFGRRPRALFLRVPGPGYDESTYARAAAEELGLKLETATLTGRPTELVADTWTLLDEPLGDTSLINGRALGKAALERGVKLLISGEGGDELFGGYHAYRAERTARLLGKVGSTAAALLRLPAAAWGGGGVSPAAGKRGFRNTARAFSAGFAWPREWGHLRWNVAATPTVWEEVCGRENAAAAREEFLKLLRKWDEAAGELAGAKATADHGTPVPSWANERPGLWMRARDIQDGLADWLLPKAAAWQRVHGVEIRFPFLAPRVINAALRLPDEELWGRGGGRETDAAVTGGAKGKKALSARYRDILPPTVLKRPKEGFSAPFKIWLRTDAELAAYLGETLFRNGGPLERWRLSPATARKLVAEHHAGKKDNSKLVWALSALAAWPV